MGNANNVKHKVTKFQLKKYRKKIYSSPDAVVVASPERGFIEVNDQAVKLFEASSREELLKFGPDVLSPKFQSHVNKTTQEVIMETWKKSVESEQGYSDLIFENISIKGNHFFVHVWVTPIIFLGKLVSQAVIKKIDNPITLEHKTEDPTEVDSSLIKPRFDDESSDSYIDTQSEPNTKSEKQNTKSEKQNSNSEKQNSNSEKQPPKQTSNGIWSKDNLDKEILKLDKEIERATKEKTRLERIKFKVLEKQLNEKTQENTQLKNEIFVLQQLLEEMKKSNNENESESQLQEEIERIKKKKKKFKTEVERLTNRLKMVEFEKENLKKLIFQEESDLPERIQNLKKVIQSKEGKSKGGNFKMCFRYVFANIKRNPRSFIIGVSSIFLVVFFVSLLDNTLKKAPWIYLALSEDTTGEIDAQITPTTYNQEVYWVNYTEMNEKLSGSSDIHGAAPRWVARANISSKTNENFQTTANVLILDTKKEKEMGLSRAWDKRVLGEEEAYVSDNLLRILGVQSNCGDRVVVNITLETILSLLGIDFPDINNATAYEETKFIFEYFFGINMNETYTINLTQVLMNLGIEVPPWIPTDNITATGEEIFDFIWPSIEILSQNNTNILQGFTSEFSVIDKIKSSEGKYPSSIGSVVMIDSRFALKSLTTTMIQTLNFYSVFADILGFGNATEIIDFLENLEINDYAFSIVIQMKDRLDAYMKSGQKFDDAFIEFSNSISYKLGYKNPNYDLSLPLYTALNGLVFIRIFLNQVFASVIALLVILCLALIYSLMISDVEEKTYEYGMLRAIGMKNNSLVLLLVIQAFSFSIPAILLGLFVSFLANLGVAKLVAGFARFPVSYTYTTEPIVLSIMIGLLMPLVANILPIRKVLAKRLRDSLDIYHESFSDVIVTMVKLAKLRISVGQTLVSLLLVVTGVVFYYGIPLTFIYLNFSGFFAIFISILIGLLFGLSLVGQVFQPFLEKLFVYLIVWGKDLHLRLLVKKNLASHRKRNKKTAVIFTTVLAFIIFSGSLSVLYSVSMKKQIQMLFGSDIVLQSLNIHDPLNKDDYISYLEDAKKYYPIDSFAFTTFPFSSNDFIDWTSVTNLPESRYFEALLYGLEEYFLESTYSEFFVIKNYTKQFNYDKVGKVKNIVKSLYTDAGKQKISVDSDFSIPEDTVSGEILPGFYYVDYKSPNQTIIKPDENNSLNSINVYQRSDDDLYINYLDVILGQSLHLSLAITPDSPIRIDNEIGISQFNKTYLVSLAKIRSMNSQCPGYFLSSYQMFALSSPAFTSIPEYLNLLNLSAEIYNNATGSNYSYTSAPIERLFVKMKSDASNDNLIDVLNGIKSVKNSNFYVYFNTPAIVDSASVAINGLLIFFNIVSVVALILCFFVLWLSFIANIRENSWEFGVLRAIGISGNQAARIYIYEAFCLVLSCILLGSIIGILIAITIFLQYLLFTEMAFEFLFPNTLYFSVIGMSLAVAFLASYLSLRTLKKKTIAVVLRGKF
ncbi:hypothetical protein M0811_10734 [Anaeramoeba ignava]|uniref:ABC3 transporter permease C-terminal domain-containing protein n=1 Tax=Anaeramoeba ignava TaxID=1746090 RepID=A0A9Q0R9F3_ANAIG|nr:hypothetical protein M0811_10734 [Anaeramoeba ignava]